MTDLGRLMSYGVVIKSCHGSDRSGVFVSSARYTNISFCLCLGHNIQPVILPVAREEVPRKYLYALSDLTALSATSASLRYSLALAHTFRGVFKPTTSHQPAAQTVICFLGP